MTTDRVPTPFEARVYALVRRIPKGHTRSYRWVAEQLGNAGLARAVGNALNRNPYLRQGFGRQAYAPQVPCHRVVKADGSLGGYAGGAAKKRRLLAAEQ